MGLHEWLRYHNTVEYLDAVENPDPDEEDDGESNNPESEWYIPPEARANMYAHARREAEIMKRFHFDDLHRDFGREPAWYYKPEVAEEKRERFLREHPKFMADYRARHGLSALDEETAYEDEGDQAESEEEQTSRGGFFGWLFGR